MLVNRLDDLLALEEIQIDLLSLSGQENGQVTKL